MTVGGKHASSPDGSSSPGARFGDIQRNFEQHGEDAVEVSVPTDRNGLLSRRIIADMVRAEQSGA